jgi:predicted DCC family thiol-disulfide oxidoreductase YuxK
VPGPTYTIFYDAHCRICQSSRQLLIRLRPSADLRFVDANDVRATAPYPQLAGQNLTGQMHVIDPGGNLTGGYDAFAALAPALPALRPFARLLQSTGVRAVGRRVYRWVARNRYRLGGAAPCTGGACRVTSPR